MLTGSTKSNPKIELGKVERIKKNQVHCLPFEDIGNNNYCCTAGRIANTERDNIVFPIGLDYHCDSQLYTLMEQRLVTSRRKPGWLTLYYTRSLRRTVFIS